VEGAASRNNIDDIRVFTLSLQVEVKPYVLDDQMCDECAGQRCGGKFAPFFCANVTCLQVSIHLRAFWYRKRSIKEKDARVFLNHH